MGGGLGGASSPTRSASLEELEQRLRKELHEVLGITARVKLVEPRSIQRSEGKAKRVVDRRDVYQ